MCIMTREREREREYSKRVGKKEKKFYFNDRDTNVLFLQRFSTFVRFSSKKDKKKRAREKKKEKEKKKEERVKKGEDRRRKGNEKSELNCNL